MRHRASLKRNVRNLGLILASWLMHGSSQADLPGLLHVESWRQTQGIAAPEAAEFVRGRGIFVSCAEGKHGWIQLLSPAGATLTAGPWIGGLVRPRGLAASADKLWVVDRRQVIGFDLDSRQEVARHSIAGAQLLNDVVVGATDTLFVSDSRRDRIHVIKGARQRVFVNLPTPNGLFLTDDHLFAVSSSTGVLYRIPLSKPKPTKLNAKPLGNLDGIAVKPNGGFYVSDYSGGRLLELTPEGKIIGGKDLLMGPADIGLIASGNLVLVPETLINSVRALEFARPIGGRPQRRVD